MKRQNGTLKYDNDGFTTNPDEKCKVKVFRNGTETIETTIAAPSRPRIQISHTQIISITVVSIITYKGTTSSVSRNWVLLTKPYDTWAFPCKLKNEER